MDLKVIKLWNFVWGVAVTGGGLSKSTSFNVELHIRQLKKQLIVDVIDGDGVYLRLYLCKT